MVKSLIQRGHVLTRLRRGIKRNSLIRRTRTNSMTGRSPQRRHGLQHPQIKGRISIAQRNFSHAKSPIRGPMRSPMQSQIRSLVASPVRPPTRFRSHSRISKKPSAPSRSQRFNPQHELSGPFISYDPSVSSTCPNIFKPTYVLSIRSERMDKFANRFSPWMQFMKHSSCVIGAYLDKAKLIRDKLLTNYGSRLKLGEIGCFLSHLNAWKCIAKSPYEFGSIFEDDADIKLSSTSQIHNAMKELSDHNVSWDILFWCIGPFPHQSNGLQECKPLKHWKKVPTNLCVSGIAYTIKKHVAISWVNRFHGITHASDIWISRTFGEFKTYCINPVLGYVVVTNESDTSHSQSPGYLKHLKRR